MFSVVIPTMQKSALLWPLLEVLQTHPDVDEILIVNNSDRDLDRDLPPKAKQIYQGPNLYVNPAWNLGAEAAQSKILAIANDDIEIDAELLSNVAATFRLDDTFGMIGPSREVVFERKRERYRTSRVWEVPAGYGVLFFMRREDYVPIPDPMLIYAGEYWLFWQQERPNLEFHGACLVTEMHTTSGATSFSRIKADDRTAYERAMAEIRGTKSWHSRARVALWLRERKRSLRRLRDVITKRDA